MKGTMPVALVTGAARGIGRATATALALRGRVDVLDNNAGISRRTSPLLELSVEE